MRGVKAKLSRQQTVAGKRRAWIAMGTLAACTVTGTGPANILAADPKGSRADSTVRQTLPVVRFAISGGSLADVLPAFQLASGWHVSISDERMATLTSRGVSGVLPPVQALRQILSGTGLTYRVTAAGEAVLEFE